MTAILASPYPSARLISPPIEKITHGAITRNIVVEQIDEYTGKVLGTWRAKTGRIYLTRDYTGVLVFDSFGFTEHDRVEFIPTPRKRRRKPKPSLSRFLQALEHP